MPDAHSKKTVDSKAEMMTPETLKLTLGELASNIDSLVDNLTMDMPETRALPSQSADEHPFEELPPDLRDVVVVDQDAPAATFESGARTADPDHAAVEATVASDAEVATPRVEPSAFSIAEDAELVDLAEGLIDSVQTNSRDASGNTRPKQPSAAKTVRQWMQETKPAQPEGEATAFDVFGPGEESLGELETTLDGQDVVGGEIDEPTVADSVAAEADVEIEVEVERQDATTASVIPWTPSEPPARSASGGLLWKLAAALAAVGLLGGGWFVWSGRGANESSALNSLDPAVDRATRSAASRVVLHSGDSGRDAASGVSTAAMVEAPGTGERIATTTTIDATPTPTPSNHAVSEMATAGERAPREMAATGDPVTRDVATIGDGDAAAMREPRVSPTAPEPARNATPDAVAANPVAIPSAQKPAQPVPTPRTISTPAVVPAARPEATISLASTAQRPVPTPTEAVKQVAPVAAQGNRGPTVPGDAPPKLTRRGMADYTERARKRGERGVVELRLLVDATGHVKRVVVEHGIPGSEIEAIAITAALQSSYEPARSGGEAVEGWANERFVFEP